MSDGGRTTKATAEHARPQTADSEPTIAPRKSGLFGASRMEAVTAEREEVAANLRRRLTVQRKANGAPAAPAIPESGGAPLSQGVRAKMEPKLGADLSNVRVHTADESQRAAEQFGARAFTVGQDVHFGAGEFAPGSREGDKLLAHELTHVVQGQRAGVQRKAEQEQAKGGANHDGAGAGVDVSHPDEPAEKEADAVAEHVSGQLEAEGPHDGGTQGDHAGEAAQAGGAQAEKASGGEQGGGKQGGKGAAQGAGKQPSGSGAKGATSAHHPQGAANGGEHHTPGGAPQGGGGHQTAADGNKGADGAAHPPSGEPHAGAGAAHPTDGKSQAAGAQSAPPAPSQAAPPIAAKRDAHKIHLSPRLDSASPVAAAGRKIFRATGTTPPAAAPAGAAATSTAGAPAAATTDPYQQFCKTLPPDLQGPAQALTDAAQKTALQTVGLAFARAFLALRQPASRLEMQALSWDQKSYLQTMALNPDELQIYETLDAAKRPAWRDQLTPDERKDAKKMPMPAMVKLLTVPAELQTWRVLRVKAVIGPDVSNKLVEAGENVAQIVDALSSSRGGDRLRRILMDPQLPPATKANFMRDVKAKLPTAPDPFEAMKQCQPNYKLLGNDASKDGQFATMELLKALPLVNFPKFGSIPPGKILEACKTAPDSDKRIPRKAGSIDIAQLTLKITTDKTLANQLASEYFPKYARESGVGTLSGCDVDIVGGRGGLPAYWVYDSKAGMTIGKVAPEQVAHALAVDENPDYLTGGVLVALPQALKADFAATKQIKRPTAIDGLGFDQFQIVEDPSQCFGITAGGVGEVVVGLTKFSQTTPKKTF